MNGNRGSVVNKTRNNRGGEGKNILYMVTATCQVLQCRCNYVLIYNDVLYITVVGSCNFGAKN